jgi:hypothetical protein
MMKRKGVLLVLGALSLGMAAMSPAPAAAVTWNTMGTSQWVWEGTGAGFSFEIVAGNFGSSDSFGLSNTAYSPSAVLIDSTYNKALMNVQPSGNEYLASFTKFTESGYPFESGSVVLGQFPKFSFYFDDVTMSSSHSYALWRDSDSPTTYIYKLAKDGQEVIFSSGNITPSVVPVPGAVVLLGSGLMGLLGIGMRKKNAVLA